MNAWTRVSVVFFIQKVSNATEFVQSVGSREAFIINVNIHAEIMCNNDS